MLFLLQIIYMLTIIIVHECLDIYYELVSMMSNICKIWCDKIYFQSHILLLPLKITLNRFKSISDIKVLNEELLLLNESLYQIWCAEIYNSMQWFWIMIFFKIKKKHLSSSLLVFFLLSSTLLVFFLNSASHPPTHYYLPLNPHIHHTYTFTLLTRPKPISQSCS